MLTDVEASAAQAADRDYKLADANGLYLFVTRSGFKSWRMKYRFGGKEKRLTFGPYPEVTLEEARERRDQARRLIRDNVDPALEKQRLRAAGLIEPEEVLPLEEAGMVAPAPALPIVPPSAAERQAVMPAPEAPAPRAVTPMFDHRSTPPSIAAAPPPPRAQEPSPVDQEPKATLPPPVSPDVVSASDGSAPRADAAQPTQAGEGARTADLAPAPKVAAAGSAGTGAHTGVTPKTPAADEPREAEAFTPDVAAGSRALQLLRQAEIAAEKALDQSRAAKRIAGVVLALFGAMALALAWWMAAGQRAPMLARSTAAVPTAASTPILAASAAAPAFPAAPLHAPSATLPTQGAPAAQPAATAPTAPSATGAAPAGSGPISPSASPAASPGSAPVADARSVRVHQWAKVSHRKRHHRHARRHKHSRRHHRATSAVAATSPALTQHAPHLRARPLSSSSETDHAITVSGSRGETVDPALDRAGRAALCLRAAYSALPSCAAVR